MKRMSGDGKAYLLLAGIYYDRNIWAGQIVFAIIIIVLRKGLLFGAFAYII